MPINNPGACSNCNIQNSNPSITNNSTNNQTHDSNAIVIQKRYNPGLLLNANLNTNSAVSSVQNVAQQTNFNIGSSSSSLQRSRTANQNNSLYNTNLSTSDIISDVQDVAQQSRFDTGALSQQKKMTQNANEKTLNILKNILDVQSDIVNIDKTSQKLRKTARQSSSKSLNISPASNTLSQNALNSLKSSSGRSEKNKTVEQKQKKKQDNNQKNRIRNIKAKSVGTDLASSTSFKTKFAVLLQQNIATENPTIEYKIPSKFDGRKVWVDYISDTRSQGICGSCWAFSSIFVLATRLSIYSKGKYNYILSPAKMVFCGLGPFENNDDNFLDNVKTNLENGSFYDFKISEKKSNIVYGCSGENLINAWQFLFRYGVPENDCFQYGDESNNDGSYFDLTNTEELPFSCSDLSSLSYDTCPTTKKRMISHRAGGFYLVPGTKSPDETKPQGSEYNIRKEIYKWGPCTSGMMVYQDFIDWDGLGIYEYDGFSQKVGGHAIVLMGWGEEQNGKKYWIVRNSWGIEWGDKGYFKILRGSNHCEIEENIIVGFPNIPSIRLFLDYPLLYQKEDFIIQNLWQIRDNGIKETTLEQLALGKLNELDILKNNSYSIPDFPNFYKFIAGKITKEKYTKKIYKNYIQNNKTFKFFVLVILFIILYFL